MYYSDIILLSETHLSEEKKFFINEFNIIRNDRDNRGGGVSICVRKKFEISKINFRDIRNEHIEVVGARIKFKNKSTMDIVSVYVPPSSNLTSTSLDAIFSNVKCPFIIGGDFNAHSTEWGCLNDSDKGEKIIDALERNNSAFLNDGSITRPRPMPLISSAIDLTITNSQNVLNCEWKVMNSTFGSDHLPISIKIKFNNNNIIPNNKIIISYKKMKEIFENDEEIEIKIKDIQNYDEFHEFLMNVKNKCQILIPEKYVNVKKPWWNADCSKALAMCIQASREFNRNGSRENYDKKIKKEKEFKKIKREAKKKGWKNYCSNINKETSISDVWKMAKIFKSGLTPANNFNVEWVDEFMDKHSPPFPLNEVNFSLFKNNDRVMPSLTIRWEDVYKKIAKLKKSGAGVDGINNKMLKLFPICMIKKLTEIFNQIIHCHNIPLAWLECRVIPIQKPHKPLNEAASKRPISIFSKTRRIFESIILEKIEKYIESENKIAKTQYGFRKGKGVRDCVAILMTDIKIAFNEKKCVTAVFLDVQQAYDNVNIERFIKHLNENGFPLKLCKLFWNLIKSRVNKYEINGKIFGSRIAHIGLAQGLPMSPMQYNLATNKLENCMEKEVYCIQLADDIVIYCINNNIQEAQKKINATIEKLVEKINDLGLNFSSSKSCCIVFSRKHKDTKIDINIKNQKIPQVNEVRYLGINLDRKLLMTKHINNVNIAGKKILNILRSTAGVSWGADPTCLDMLYKGISRSRMEFCSFVYPENKSLIKLERIQWKAARIISGCMQSTPTNALEVITNLPPIKTRFKKLNFKFFCMISSQPLHPLNIKLKKLNDMGVNFMKFPIIKELFKFKKFPFLSENEWINNKIVDLKLQKKIGKKDDSNGLIIKAFSNEALNKYSDFKLIFTDGSKKENSTTAAFHEMNGCEIKFKLSPQNHSIFTAECLGIKKALDHIDQHHPQVKKMCIVTDSMSACTAIENSKNTFKTHFIIGSIMNKISEMSMSGKIIKILWVPSHCDIMGNERADELANDAHENPDDIIKIEKNFKEISENFYFTYLLKEWQENWDKSEKGRYTYSIIPKINTMAWHKNSHFSRLDNIFWHRLLSNHTRSASSLNRFNNANNPICSCNKNYQTVNHIIFECERTNDETMKQKLKNIGYNPPWNIRDIMALEINSNEKAAMKIISEHMTKKLLEMKLI